MKIGIWLNELIDSTLGGGASYTNRIVSLIDNHQFPEGIEICYVSIFPNKNLSKEVVNVSQIPLFLYRLCKGSPFLSYMLRLIDLKLIRIRGMKSLLRGTNIKILYYLQQVTMMDSNFPFISTNWDIGHRSSFPFPEICQNKEFEKRDEFYMNVLPKALLIICESETGKKELVNFTNIGSHKIRIMPMFAGNVSSLCVSDEKMRIIMEKDGVVPFRFFYYPAQFWAHKNHIGLLRAFKKYICEYDSSYKLVLCGSDKSNLDYVKKYVSIMGIDNNVTFLGFIQDEEVYTLYKNALCLVMASHFGPTNMPPIEAMELGCPVICSDIGGHREILGDSGVYFDSFDYHSIYRGLIEITEKREYYVSKICEQRNKTIFNSKNAIDSLDSILQEAVIIRSNWE